MSLDMHKIGASLPQIEIEKKLHLTDSVMGMEMNIPAGAMFGKEKHNYSHLSFLMKGEAKIYRGDEVEEISAPSIIEVKANVLHACEAITDVIWVCVHSAEETDVTTHE